jgi:hypothetical protein
MASATIAGPEWFLRADLPDNLPDSMAGAPLALPSPVVRAEVFTREGAPFVRGFGPEQSLEAAIDAVRSLDPSVAAGLVVEIEPADDAPYAEVVRLHAALVNAGATARLR